MYINTLWKRSGKFCIWLDVYVGFKMFRSTGVEILYVLHVKFSSKIELSWKKMWISFPGMALPPLLNP